MPHHIVQRGHNRNAVFVEDADYIYYLENLRELKQEFDIKVYAWCLMTNHVHLVLQPEQNNRAIGQLMKRLAGRQTRYVNQQEKRTGSLWEGRYKLSIVDRDAYLLQCCRYVELNPVKAAMVLKAEDYSWSSYKAKVGLFDSPLLDLDPCYQALKHPKIQYKQFVEEGISDEEQSFIAERLSRSQLTGGSKFMEEIEHRTGIRLVARPPGRPRK